MSPGAKSPRRGNPRALRIEIPISRLQPYECKAILLSYLAYPSSGEAIQRAVAQNAICNSLLRTKAEAEPEWSGCPQQLTPNHLLLDKKELARMILRINGNLKRRMAAGSMAQQFMFNEFRIVQARVQEEKAVKPISIACSADRSILLNGIDPVNIHSRIWTPSTPVLHLALGTYLMTRPSERYEWKVHNTDGIPSLLFADHFVDYEDIEAIINISNMVTRMFFSIPKLREISKQLIQFWRS